MDDIKILSEIKLKRNSHVPICKQLETQLEKLIVTYPHNTRFPSERKVSTLLKIDRGTVQHALKGFIKSGKIIRNGCKGTFINKIHENETETSTNNSGMHPMLLNNFTFDIVTQIPIKKLNVILYEDIPFQKDFWNSLVNLFNKQNSDFNVSIEWVPRSITYEHFEDYLHTRKPDIFQTFLTSIRIPWATELPESIYEKLRSNEYLHEHFWNLKYTFFRRIVPMYFSAPCIFWNKRMARKLKINDSYKFFTQEGLLDAFKKIASKRTDFIRSSDLWNYVKFSGIPLCASLSMKDVIREKFTEAFAIGDMCNISGENAQDDTVTEFLSGRKIFHLDQPLELYARCKDYSFGPECAFIRLKKDFFNHSGTVGLSIYHESINKNNAFKFLEFCISQEAQELIIDKLHAISFHRKANERYFKIFPDMLPNELTDVIKSVKSFYHSEKLLVSPFMQTAYKVFNKLLSHNISMNDAVESAYGAYKTYCEKCGCGSQDYSNPWSEYLEK